MSHYYVASGTDMGSTESSIMVSGEASWGDAVVSGNLSVKSGERGINPILAFKYIKKKFNFLERSMIDRRLKHLEKAFDKAMEWLYTEVKLR